MARYLCLGLMLLAPLVIVTAKPNQQDLDYNDDQAYEYDGDYGDEEQNDFEGQSKEQNSISAIRPVIVSQPEHLVVDNGMTISLPCTVDQIPAGVQIMWQKMDSKKTIIAIGSRVIDPQLDGRAFVTVTDKGSTLAIGAAKSEDAGQYKCEVAVQHSPPEIVHTVSIRAPPSISSSSPQAVTVEKGQDVTLSCKGQGSPQPRVMWTRQGHSMPDGADSVEGDSITFSRVTRKHAGIYRCTAHNGHGHGATKEMEVVVRYKPEVEVSQVYVHKQEGDQAELLCSVHAFPPATVTWTKSGAAVAASPRVRIDHRGGRHSLSFQKLERADFGSYSCQASNDLGSGDTATVRLSGHAMPAEFRSSSDGTEDTSFLLEWSSFSFTPVQEFRLETRPASSSSWTQQPVAPPTKEKGPHLWAGKVYLSSLLPATQYLARVTASNGEGWGEAGQAWSFATRGAAPLVSAKAGSLSLSASCFHLLLAGALLLRRL